MSLRHNLRVVRAVAAADIRLTLREPLFAIIGVVIPINFLLLFLLFALSGGQAPIAVVMNDQGPLAEHFVQAMGNSSSFVIHTASPADAEREIRVRHHCRRGYGATGLRRRLGRQGADRHSRGSQQP